MMPQNFIHLNAGETVAFMIGWWPTRQKDKVHHLDFGNVFNQYLHFESHKLI